MRARPIVALLAVALLAAPACGRNGKDDDAFRLRLEGRARVESGAERRTLDDGDHKLAVGDVLHMLDGTGTLELPGDRAVRVRAGDGGDSVVEVGATPEIVDGDAVVVAGGDGATFRAGDVDVRMAEGAARIHRGLNVTIAMYRGRAEVRTAGRELPDGLAALRQVSIAATGQVPRDPAPLVYDDRDPDPWDREFLGDAIDLGRDLDQRSRGLTGQLGPRVRVDASLLGRVLPALSKEPVSLERVAGRSAGEAVVGGAIAVEASTSKDLTTAWDEVFRFRAAGAKWGLVALDQQVKRDALKSRLDDAAGRSPVLFAASPRRSSSSGTATPTSQPPASRSGGSGGGSGGGPTTTTTTPPSQPTPTTIPTPLGPITVPPAPSSPPDDGGDGGEGGEPSTPVDVVTNLVDDLLEGATSTTTIVDTNGLLP